MNVAVFMMLLTAFSTVTSLTVQALKKILDEHGTKYASNALVCIVAGVVGIGGTAVYYVLGNIAFSSANVILMVLMGLAVSIGSMVGYDKVIQTIKQFAIPQ